MAVKTLKDRATVTRLQALLDPSRPDFRGSQAIRDVFATLDVRVYMDSWVLPLLDELKGVKK